MDVHPQQSMLHPELYHVGPAGDLFSSPVFLGWILEGLWGAVVCFFVPLYVFSGPDMNGKILGMWGEGIAIMTCVIMTVTARISVETRFWTWIHALSYGLSLASWFAFVAVMSIITYPGSDTGSGTHSRPYNTLCAPLYSLCVLIPFHTVVISLHKLLVPSSTCWNRTVIFWLVHRGFVFVWPQLYGLVSSGLLDAWIHCNWYLAAASVYIRFILQSYQSIHRILGSHVCRWRGERRIDEGG